MEGEILKSGAARQILLAAVREHACVDFAAVELHQQCRVLTVASGS